MLSKTVKEIYLDFVSNIQNYTIGHCVMSTKMEGITIWTSNDIDSRRFYTHDSKLEDKVKQLNSELTQGDKLLLDKMFKVLSDYKNVCDKRTESLSKII